MFKKKSIIPVVLILCLLLVSFQKKSNFTRERAQKAEEEVKLLNQQIKQQGLDWVAGKTSMTLLSPEQRKMMLGEIVPTYEDPTQFIQVPQPEQMLAAIDWRSRDGYDWTTPAKNQLTCGSCWAFALMSTFETTWKIEQIQPLATPDGSEMILLRCSGAGTCDGGITYNAAGWMITNGACPDSDYAYQPSDGTCNLPANYPANAWRISDRGWITQLTIDTAAIKNALQTYGPVVGHMQVYNSFYAYTSGVYSPLSEETTQGAHAITIVGFDDAQNCWICNNTWGTGWGDNGFFKIAMNQTSPPTEMGMWVFRIWGASLQNQAPVLDAVGSKTVKEGEQLVVQLSATDPDQNPLTYTCTNKPSGAAFNTGTGKFTWTPDYTQGSTPQNSVYKDYAVTFGVSDGIASDTEGINIRVYNRKKAKGRF